MIMLRLCNALLALLDMSLNKLGGQSTFECLAVIAVDWAVLQYDDGHRLLKENTYLSL